MEQAGCEKGYRALLSCFICLSLLTVLWMNRPWKLESWVNFALDSLRGGTLLRTLIWADEQYAHAVGLDNRWKMFGEQTRYNWWYLIKATYRDSSSELLPLPRQSGRSFWEHNLFDFKEAKFHLNIYPSRSARRAYALYLCRQYPANERSRVDSITFEWQVQPILSPSEARFRGNHLSSRVMKKNLDTFSCSDATE